MNIKNITVHKEMVEQVTGWIVEFDEPVKVGQKFKQLAHRFDPKCHDVTIHDIEIIESLGNNKFLCHSSGMALR